MITILLSQKVLEIQETIRSLETIRLNKFSLQNEIEILPTFCTSERTYHNSLQNLSIWQNLAGIAQSV
jgi:hypothetical protein